ncbi:MAG: hypothetical protein ACFCD0_12685 [Gemmataceae bacterium]
MKTMRLLLLVGVVGLLVGGQVVAQNQKNKGKKVTAKQLSKDIMVVLENAQSIEFYSLDPHVKKKVKDGFSGYPILGKVTLKNKARKTVLEAVLKGIKKGQPGAKCFIPRHGIRAKHGDDVVELVICFQCSWVYSYLNGKQNNTVTIHESSAPALNTVLKKENIKVAK